MFYVADDDRRIVDSRGRVVGFVNGEKFTQYRTGVGGGIVEASEDPYLHGLSPLELELVSETIQCNKIRKTGSDGEGL